MRTSHVIQDAFATFISWGVALAIITVLILLVLSGLIGFESVTHGTEYFVENGVKPGPEDPTIIVY